MSDKQSLIDSVFEKREKLKEIHAALSVYMGTNLSKKTMAQMKEKQDRLEYRVMQYEDQLLDEKIKIYQETLNIAKKDQNVKV